MKEDCNQALFDYSVALASARYFASQTLQPVVMLGVTKTDLHLHHMRQYLERLGAIVI